MPIVDLLCINDINFIETVVHRETALLIS